MADLPRRVNLSRASLSPLLEHYERLVVSSLSKCTKNICALQRRVDTNATGMIDIGLPSSFFLAVIDSASCSGNTENEPEKKQQEKENAASRIRTYAGEPI